MQKSYKYLIIGSGRLAYHFCHYLTLLKIPFQRWSRRDKTCLTLTSDINKIVLLISDDAIEDFIQKNPSLHDKILIHFSGSLVTSLAFGFHPLMTFTYNSPYPLNTYKKICFIGEEGSPSFSDFFPELKNKSFKIPRELKPLYHSFCVLSANCTALLWQKFFSELKHKLKLPEEVMYPFLKQTMLNILENANSALTGPLIRGDKKTIAGNLQALTNDPYQEVYQAFVNLYEKKK